MDLSRGELTSIYFENFPGGRSFSERSGIVADIDHGEETKSGAGGGRSKHGNSAGFSAPLLSPEAGGACNGMPHEKLLAGQEIQV